MGSSDHLKKGQAAEKLACDFLETKGLELLVQNFRCYHGEIDLIMRDKADIVFVEVRYRRRIDYGNAVESINHSKIKKLNQAAVYFLQKKRWLNSVASRFDVVAIHPIAGKMEVEWIKNAFYATF